MVEIKNEDVSINITDRCMSSAYSVKQAYTLQSSHFLCCSAMITFTQGVFSKYRVANLHWLHYLRSMLLCQQYTLSAERIAQWYFYRKIFYTHISSPSSFFFSSYV